MASYQISRRTWRGIEIEIRWNPEYQRFHNGSGIAHLVVLSVEPARAPLPITETGYRSHFTPESAVMRYGSVENFVEAWLEERARSPKWRSVERAWKQLSLF